MKTIIYVDGFNLFYGCLKHSADKWLDIKKLLFDHIVKIQEPSSQLVALKYFTANIKTKIATNGQEAQTAQNNYHRALKTIYPEKIVFVKGYFSLERANLLNYKNPPDKKSRSMVWKLEEKQSDVNIALEAYRDANKNKAKQLIFVSNDTDIAPALRAIREDFQDDINIGLILPIRKTSNEKSHRPGNKHLSNFANWTRKSITGEELQKSHLPEKIPTKKKPIIKPAYW